MVSSPRVLEYELMVIEFAIDLLESYGKAGLLRKSSYEEDMKKLESDLSY